MTEVLFTHSYVLAFDPKELRAMMPYPPLGTLHAAAAVRADGYAVTLFDAMFIARAEEIDDALDRLGPKYVVICDDDFNYLTKMCLVRMREVALAFTRHASDRGCTVIVHSSDATDNADLYFDGGADFVLIGEAELTLVELLRALETNVGRDPSEVPGVATRDTDGTLRRAARRPVMRELDELPPPALELVDIDAYRSRWMRRHGYFSVGMVTTRGCPFHCNWCAKPLYGQVYNSHSPERIASEAVRVDREWSPDHIWFCDDIFGLQPGWVAAFADELEQHGVRVPFKCLSRADLLLRDDVIAHLARAGCQTVWIGAESGSQKILDAMDKGITVDQILEATQRLRSAGIRVGFFLQFGYPGEQAEEIRQTIRMVRAARPEEIGISVSYPLPGTVFHERVRREMGMKRNWEESADLAMMYRGTYSTEFYRRLQRWMHMDHRTALAVDALRAIARGSLPSRRELRRIALAPAYLAGRMIAGAGMLSV